MYSFIPRRCIQEKSFWKSTFCSCVLCSRVRVRGSFLGSSSLLCKSRPSEEFSDKLSFRNIVFWGFSWAEARKWSIHHSEGATLGSRCWVRLTNLHSDLTWVEHFHKSCSVFTFLMDSIWIKKYIYIDAFQTTSAMGGVASAVWYQGIFSILLSMVSLPPPTGRILRRRNKKHGAEI